MPDYVPTEAEVAADIASLQERGLLPPEPKVLTDAEKTAAANASRQQAIDAANSPEMQTGVPSWSSRTPSQVAEDRRDWIKMFDSVMEFRGIPIVDRAAQLQMWASEFDKGAGFTPEMAQQVEAQQRASDHGVAGPSTKPTDYQAQYHHSVLSSLAPDRLVQVNSEMQEWAAKMQFDPAIGASIISHISEIGPKLAKMQAEDIAAWCVEQRAITMSSIGEDLSGRSDEYKQAALRKHQSLRDYERNERHDAMIERAKGILAMAGKDNGFSKALASNNALLSDAFLLSMILNHGERMEAYRKATAK